MNFLQQRMLLLSLSPLTCSTTTKLYEFKFPVKFTDLAEIVLYIDELLKGKQKDQRRT